LSVVHFQDLKEQPRNTPNTRNASPACFPFRVF
jgi:hypothetical protein